MVSSVPFHATVAGLDSGVRASGTSDGFVKGRFTAAMIGSSTGQPFLDFLSVAVGLVLGFLFVSDPRGPLAQLSVIARYAGFLAVAFFDIAVIARVLSFFVPLLSSGSGATSVWDFLAGVILLGALVAAYLVLQGTLRVQLPRELHPARDGSVEPVAALQCPRCARPIPAEAAFCSWCGSPINPTPPQSVSRGSTIVSA